MVRDEAGRVRAVAPLHTRPLGPLRAVRWLGTGLGSVCEVVAAPGDDDAADAVWSSLHPSRDVLDLVEYVVAGAGSGGLGPASTHPVRRTPMESCPVIDLAAVGSAAGLLSTRKNLRKALARAERATDQSGRPFTVEAVTDAARVSDVLPEIVAVVDAAEAARPRQHLLRPPWRDFTVSALTDAAHRGQLAAFVGRHGDRPVSIDINFVVGSRMGAWFGRFDPTAAEISPGHQLLRAEVGWAVDTGLRTIDLLVGEDDYKMRWATGTYATEHVVGGSSLARSVGTRLVDGRQRLHHMVQYRHRA